VLLGNTDSDVTFVVYQLVGETFEDRTRASVKVYNIIFNALVNIVQVNLYC